MIRYYLVPYIVQRMFNDETGKWEDTDTRIIKYLSGSGASFNATPYGRTDLALVRADVTNPQHTQLIAQSDVVRIPALDNTVGTTALTTVRSEIEALNIPANWVQTTHTYREILRMIWGLFTFARIHNKRHGQKIKPDNITLSQTWSDLPLAWRQNLADTAVFLNYDTSGVTGATTVRQIFKSLADEWGNTPINFGGEFI